MRIDGTRRTKPGSRAGLRFARVSLRYFAHLRGIGNHAAFPFTARGVVVSTNLEKLPRPLQRDQDGEHGITVRGRTVGG
jgi:hypothetical protein